MTVPADELTALGWTPRLEALFEPYRAAGLVPARISLEHTHIYRVLILAETNVHTDENGVARLVLDLATEISPGATVSASATADHNTSDLTRIVSRFG